MNQEKIDKIVTLQTVTSFLEANGQLWRSIPIIETYANHLEEVIKGLDEATVDESGLPKLTNTTLPQLRITVAEKMDILDDILEAYAEDTNNSRLLSEAENSKSDYLRLTNDGFERKVNSVLKLLEKNLEQMRPYGITHKEIEDASDAFALYKKTRSEPPNKGSAISIDENIDHLLQEGISVVERLDIVMVRFRSSHPSFYNGFKMISSFEERTDQM